MIKNKVIYILLKNAKKLKIMLAFIKMMMQNETRVLKENNAKKENCKKIKKNCNLLQFILAFTYTLVQNVKRVEEKHKSLSQKKF